MVGALGLTDPGVIEIDGLLIPDAGGLFLAALAVQVLAGAVCVVSGDGPPVRASSQRAPISGPLPSRAKPMRCAVFPVSSRANWAARCRGLPNLWIAVRATVAGSGPVALVICSM